jgi:hypothetical protein
MAKFRVKISAFENFTKLTAEKMLYPSTIRVTLRAKIKGVFDEKSLVLKILQSFMIMENTTSPHIP